MQVQLKRAYEPASSEDGYRILVDRLWPRGVSKEKAKIDWWFKEIAPSPELRKWFDHDPEKWKEFCRRYRRELEANAEGIGQLQQRMKEGPVTLVYGAKDPEHNHALALSEYLSSKSTKKSKS